MFSALLPKATIAGYLAGFIWIVSYIPYVLSRTTLTSKWIACIFSNTALAHGSRLIMEFEYIKGGLQWSDFWAPALNTDDLSVGITVCYMLGSSLFQLLVAICVESNLADMLRMWPCKKRAQIQSASSNQNFENIDPNRVAKITLNHLRKAYSRRKIAVDNFTMSIFSNQISILYGDNGAGKSSIMKMMAGLCAPTSGKVTVDGCDIQKDLQKARHSMSFCPQQNIVYEELTVREHIELFSQLKGMHKKNAKNEAISYAQHLGMEQYIEERTKQLSAETKRKLSIAITLCGKSEIIICDEPTLGLIPPDRYAIWDLLQREKDRRTIVLATSLMDETNIGDQIAIMVEGKLKCCGTPAFLNERFGGGEYRLVCEKGNNCVPNNVTEILQQFIPGIDIHESTSRELVYVLPLQHANKFEKLFERLEDKQQDSGVRSFSVYSTPIELLYGQIASNSIPMNERSSRTSIGSRHTLCRKPENSSSDSFEYPDSRDISLLRGCRLYANQWHAMFKKRFNCWWHGRHSISKISLQFDIPILLILSISFVTSPKQFLPKREINLSEYGKTITLLQYPSDSNDTA